MLDPLDANDSHRMEPNERIFGHPDIPPEDPECEVCHECACKYDEPIKAEEVIGYNRRKWLGLPRRNSGKSLLPKRCHLRISYSIIVFFFDHRVPQKWIGNEIAESR